MTGTLALELDAAAQVPGATGGIADASGRIRLVMLADLADSVRSGLQAAGCSPDEPVGVLVSNRARDVGALWGIWKAGAVAAPIHRTTPAAVLAELADRLKARFIVDTEPQRTATALPRDALRDGFLIRLDHAQPPPRPALRNAALIVFTSGTTGLPKGAVLSHAAISGKLSANNSLLHFDADTRTLLVLQITFSFGMWVSLLTLTRGGWLHMEERFETSRLLPAFAEGQITHAALVPTMIRALFSAKNEGELQEQIKYLGGMHHVRQLLAGGEHLGSVLGARLSALFPSAHLFDIYGLTETATSDFFLTPADQQEFAGCIGRPAPGVSFRIAGPASEPVPLGQPGELQIHTPYLMNGYLDAPELTTAALSDGYFRTGDIARERAPGIVELVGRSKELISRGANKVSPLEIEHALSSHPSVAEALACGVADALLGERIHALVVLRPGRHLLEAELRTWAAERLERYKVPDQFHFGTELPLGRTGKSDRIRLRQMLSSPQ